MFDPQDPSVLEDPYPHYARLRSEAPVLWLPDYEVWVVTGFQDIATILQDTATFSSRLGLAARADLFGPAQTGVRFRIGAPGVRVLIALDPPDHGVFRRAVAEAFTGKRIARLRESVHTVAHHQVRELIDRANAGEADFFRDVAEPVPALVLAELFGLPAEMRAELRTWANLVTSDLAADARGGLGRGMAMLRYFRTETAKRRGSGGSDLLDLLADAPTHGLSEYEVLSFCGFLVVAGVETTTNQLTNLMDVLINRPDIQDTLRQDPALIPAAVEESLRYDTAVQALWRSTTTETVLSGHHLPPDARILVMFGSANRDGTHYPAPDDFLLTRNPNDHLSFGRGHHYCLGARLARLEMETVLTELLRTSKAITGTGRSERLQSIALRGFTRQEVEIVAAADRPGQRVPGFLT